MECKAEKRWFARGLSCLLLMSVATVATAQEIAIEQPIATETRTRDQIVLDPRIDAEGWMLRIAGPEGVTQRFDAVTAPVIHLVDDEGEILADGTYHYELVPVFSEEEEAETRDATPFTGSFRVRGGAIAIPRAGDVGSGTEAFQPEAPGPPEASPQAGALHTKRSADTALSDDYCIGNGCSTIGSFPINSLSTGYLKLKGSATGIVFTDLNNPSGSERDWQIGINDGISVGANFFAVYDNGLTNDSGAQDATNALSVPFRIDESAPTDSIRVLGSSGNVGMGTATPGQELEIFASSPTIRLADSGAIEWNLNNASSSTVFDIVSTALGTSSVRHLYINRGAPADQLVLQPTGVGIGTSTPTGNLHIFGNSNQDTFNAIGPNGITDALNFGYSGNTFGPGSGFFNVRPAPGASAPNPAIYFATANLERMTIDNQGYIAVHQDGILANGFDPSHPIHAQVSGARLTAAGVWTNASSRALKENVGPLAATEAFKALQALEPVHYNYKLDPSDPQLGFIAEDVPEIVATPDRTGMAAIEVVAVLTKVVQEQQQMLEEQRELIDELLRRTDGLDIEP